MSKKVMKTMDGNTAAAYTSYAFTDVAAIYPITPSSPMAEHVDTWSAEGKKNIFGETVDVIELQSEGGASGAVHGALTGGALTTTFTASQGLLLMLPNMYKISGELLPGVFHVSARSIATHALSIFGDHSDVMAARPTGFAMIASGSVQEVADLAAVSHLAAIKSSLPFLHFFDGFRTSHEIQKIELMDYDTYADLLDFDAVQAFRNNALNPEHPVTKGTAENPDIFFQARESINKFYDELPHTIADYMAQVSEITGRDYRPFTYYGAEDAKYVVIAMGSVTEAAEETVDYLMNKGEKVGLMKVHLYRPFSAEYFFKSLPDSVERIAVLDRTKEPGSVYEPLCQDVQSVFYGRENTPIIVGGRYGLSSKDTTPSHIKAVYDNLKAYQPKDKFTIGIIDDVTHTHLEVKEEISTEPAGTVRCKFWGLGSDGTVGANKNAIKIIGDNTDMYAQGYFSYDSKKSGGVTVSHLRFGENKITSTYLISEADFISCSQQSYVEKGYDLVGDLKEEGTFLLNTIWSEDEVKENLPNYLKRDLAEKKAKLYTINATKIAEEIGLGHRINMVIQTAFFKLSKVMDVDAAVKLLKEAVVKSYGHKGDKIVNMNHEAIDRGFEEIKEIAIPAEWAELSTKEDEVDLDRPEFIRNVVDVVNAQKGDDLPVSTFIGREDGSFPQGSSAYEKRGVAVNVPHWKDDKCIQCNQCSFVCPHAVIRPVLLDEEEMNNAPDTLRTLDARGKAFEGLKYTMQVSPLDCQGCEVCANTCPVDALEMVPIDTQLPVENDNWNYTIDNVSIKDDLMNKYSVKGSQFAMPYVEFTGACAGCGETPYLKAVTQLFGDRMLIANATGCSSIWGGTAPISVFTTNEDGHGPAWANSLFEDNAEYGFGMALAAKKMRKMLARRVDELLEEDICSEAKDAMNEWIENIDDGEGSKAAATKIKKALASCDPRDERVKFIKDNSDFLTKRSTWIVGGDGWAYDIGYGGLDHVLASNEDVNVLVFDTEVYSNTGGQASKATPTGAVAKFAASGMKTKKKDLGLMASNYGYVYVAQTSIGANMNQFMKAIKEAEAYKGPSLILCYAPCINHGIKKGMGHSINQEKFAVESGYWHLYRFNPELKAEGKNPFILDSKEPKKEIKDFLASEVRYTSLQKKFPKIAEELFEIAAEDAKERYETYKRLAEMEY